MASIVDAFCHAVLGITDEPIPMLSAEPSSSQNVDATIFDPSKCVGQQSLQNSGWREGAIMTLKKKDAKEQPKADSQFELTYINEDGSAGLCPIDADGNTKRDEIIVVQAIDIVNDYKKLDPKDRLSKLDVTLPVPFNMTEGLFNALAVIGVNEAFANNSLCPSGSIYIQKTPTQKVIVASLECDGLQAVPWSPTMKNCTTKSDGFKKLLTVSVLGMDDTTLAEFSIDMPGDLPYSGAFFWKIRRSSDETCCNMKMAIVNAKVPLPKMSSVESKVPKHVIVTVPYAVLSKPVRQGDELVLYVPDKKAQAKSKVLPPKWESDAQPVQKKQKRAA